MTFEEFKVKAKETGIPFELFTDAGFLNGYTAEIPSHTRYIGLFCRIDGTNLSVKVGLPWIGKSYIRFFDSFEQIKEAFANDLR